MKFSAILLILVSALSVAGAENRANVRTLDNRDVHVADNGTVNVGIDAAMGASITHLSWEGYRKNTVNIHDPGRLIQQSYYAGKSLDRRSAGQSQAWSPWPWNPIQGGGVGSWARVTRLEKDQQGHLYAETIPKLWDMADEEAAAVMKQWTGFEPGLPNAVVVRCELVCQRSEDDIWGLKGRRHQEIPAVYLTRNFSVFRLYLGDGKWEEIQQEPGPPWGKVEVPLNIMACFNRRGQGVAVFSPGATEKWNFGPHGGGNSSESTDGPCVHVSPIAMTNLQPKSVLRYRYWMVVGTEEEIVPALESLLEKYATEKVVVSEPED